MSTQAYAASVYYNGANATATWNGGRGQWIKKRNQLERLATA